MFSVLIKREIRDMNLETLQLNCRKIALDNLIGAIRVHNSFIHFLKCSRTL